MTHHVTVHANTPDGGLAQITLAQTGPDTGSSRVETWPAGTSPSGPAGTDDSFDLFGIRAGDNDRRIACNVRVFGFFVPTVTLVVEPDPAGPPSVTVTIEHSLFKDGITRYPIDGHQAAAIIAFVHQAGFPAIGT